MANEQGTNKKQEQWTRGLPKNFRQIGEPGAKKIYMEDYVYTYLNKLAQPSNLYARGAVLFGKVCKTPIGNCMFISGAAACQNFEFDLEESVFTEENWNDVYRIRDKFFPDLEVAGWFLSRMGFSTELNDKIIRTHMNNFGGENKVLYMIDALENEDAFYQFENYSLKKQKGYYIYYETNQEMKEYMLSEGEAEKESEEKKRSPTIQRDSSVVKNYKRAMKQKKKLRKKTFPPFGTASMAGVLAMVLVLFYGARSVRQFRMEENAAEVFQQQTVEEQPSFKGEPDMEDSAATTELPEDVDKESNLEKKVGGSSEETVYTEEKKNTKPEENVQDFLSTEEMSGEPTPALKEENTAAQRKEGATEREETKESWSYMGKQYIVQSGDTLAGISKRMYQSYDYIEMLAEANQIDNLDEIYPGQVLDIPPIED